MCYVGRKDDKLPSRDITSSPLLLASLCSVARSKIIKFLPTLLRDRNLLKTIEKYRLFSHCRRGSTTKSLFRSWMTNWKLEC